MQEFERKNYDEEWPVVEKLEEKNDELLFVARL